MTNLEIIKRAVGAVHKSSDSHYCCKYNTFRRNDFCDECLRITPTIRLADILLAIDKAGIRGALSVHPDGSFSEQYELGKFRMTCFWNLRDDDAEHQSEQTKAFLAGLLKETS